MPENYSEPEETILNEAEKSRQSQEMIDEDLHRMESAMDVDAMQQSPITSAPVEDKEYGQSRVRATEEELNRPIPEPSFEPPPMNQTAGGPNAGGTTSGTGSTTGGKKPPAEVANPAMQEMSNREKKIAAEHLADLALGGYEMMHDWMNKSLVIKESKLNKLQADGKIDLNVNIPYEYGKMIRAGDLFREYNMQMATAFEVSSSFKARAKPLMVNMFAEQGLGATNNQMLLAVFLQDSFAKMVQFITVKRSTKSMLDFYGEVTMRKHNMSPEERAREEAGMSIVNPIQPANSFVDVPDEKQKVRMPETPADVQKAASAESPKTEAPKSEPLRTTEQANFKQAPPQSNGQSAGAFVNDHSATKTGTVKEPVKTDVLNADNIDEAFSSIAKENEDVKESSQQVLNKTNREKRTRSAPAKAGYGSAGAPTKEEREIRKQQLISEKKKEQVTEDAVIVETTTVIKETPVTGYKNESEDRDSEEPVVVELDDVPGVSSVGSDLNDIDL
jgi:hypothetical protein